MSKAPLIERVRALAATRDAVAAVLMSSPLAPPGKSLSAAAFGMWITRGEVPLMWQAAALERLGEISADGNGRAA